MILFGVQGIISIFTLEVDFFKKMWIQSGVMHTRSNIYTDLHSCLFLLPYCFYRTIGHKAKNPTIIGLLDIAQFD